MKPPVVANIFPLTHQYVPAERILQRAAFWVRARKMSQFHSQRNDKNTAKIPQEKAISLRELHKLLALALQALHLPLLITLNLEP
jgi:hypothetical protein